MKLFLYLPLLLLSSLCFSDCAQAAEVGAGLRLSTFGFTGDLDVRAGKWATIRLGYHGLNYGRDVDETSVHYQGNLVISAASLIVDWHTSADGFHMSVGAVSNGPKVNITATPTNGTYTFNGTTYQAADVGSATGTITMGKSLATYVGLGWGSAVSKRRPISFLFDIGAIHTGPPSTTLNVTCNSSLPSAQCDQLISDADAEKADLEDKAGRYRWYAVVSLGVGLRF